MSDVNNTKALFSVVSTLSSKINDLDIKNGQLIFMSDAHRIAMDFKDKRVFYNQITELETDEDRLVLTNPLNGFYFVLSDATLWHYTNGWTQITRKPDEIIYIGNDLPTIGQGNKIYVDTNNREISVWNETENQYVTVANYTEPITSEDVENLFK